MEGLNWDKISGVGEEWYEKLNGRTPTRNCVVGTSEATHEVKAKILDEDGW